VREWCPCRRRDQRREWAQRGKGGVEGKQIDMSLKLTALIYAMVKSFVLISFTRLN
jgi:hypothetical protein